MSRDNYGSGSLRLRGGVWHYDLMVGGERKRGSTGKTKKSDAQIELRRLLGKRERGEVEKAASKGMTVSDLLDFYINRKSKLKSIATYRGHADMRLKPFLGAIQVSKLTAQHLQHYRDVRAAQIVQTNRNCEKSKHGKGCVGKYKDSRLVSQSTINREIGTLRAAYREMQRYRPDVITSMPYFPMESEKDRIRRGFISEKDLKDSLLPKLPPHLKPLVVCAFYCGGRTGEWLRLNWGEVDFENGLIYFPQTKNGDAREVPIFNGLMKETLLHHKAIRDTLWPNLDAVFTFDGITRLRVFKRSWKTAMRRAGFPDLTPHDLRRSASRWMRNKGITRDVRKTIMGHKTNSMDDRYSIVDKADLDAAKLLGGQ